MSPGVDIVYTCDRHFVPFVAVSIKSLLEVCEEKGQRLNIHVVCVGFESSDREILKRIVQQHDNSEIQFVEYVLSGRYASCPYAHAEIVTLIYFLPEILPTLEKLIFVDGDTMFLRDPRRLAEIDLGESWIATCPAVNHDDSVLEFNARNGTTAFFASDTINAGIMVLDLERMRKEKVTDTLDSFTEANQSRLWNPEQLVIAYCYPQRAQIPHEWNWRGALCVSEPFWAAPRTEITDDYLALEPAMVHFQAPYRPNNTLIKSTYFSMWLGHYNELKLPPVVRRRVSFGMFIRIQAPTIPTIFGLFKNPRVEFLRNPRFLVASVLKYIKYLMRPCEFEFDKVQ